MSRAVAIRFSVLTLIAVATHTLATVALAADATCKPVLDAKAKQAVTPNHQYITETAATQSGAKKSEVIVTATAMYINVDGSWQRRDFSPQKEVADLREAAQSSHIACKYLRDESVDGEAAAVYVARDDQEGSSVNSQDWISKSRNLPLKQTMDIDVGGKFGKSHHEVRIDYSDVRAPTGVN